MALCDENTKTRQTLTVLPPRERPMHQGHVQCEFFDTEQGARVQCARPVFGSRETWNCVLRLWVEAENDQKWKKVPYFPFLVWGWWALNQDRFKVALHKLECPVGRFPHMWCEARYCTHQNRQTKLGASKPKQGCHACCMAKTLNPQERSTLTSSWSPHLHIWDPFLVHVGSARNEQNWA